MSYRIVKMGAHAGGGRFPASLQNEWWLRSDLRIELDVGSNIKAWRNIGTAGGALDVEQSVAINQPSLITSDPNFNNQPSVDWDGDDRVLAAAVTTALDLADAESIEIIVVARTTSLSTFETMVSTSGTGDGRQLCDLITPFRIRWTFDAAGSPEDLVNGPAVSVNTVHVMRWERSAVASPGNDTFQMFVDGSAGTPLVADRGAIAPGANLMDWRIGDDFDGQIVEVMARTTSLYTTTEKADLTSYFNNRYGLSISGV